MGKVVATLTVVTDPGTTNKTPFTVLKARIMDALQKPQEATVDATSWTPSADPSVSVSLSVEFDDVASGDFQFFADAEDASGNSIGITFSGSGTVPPEDVSNPFPQVTAVTFAPSV